MKRLLMVSVIAMLIAGGAFAQTVKEQKNGAAASGSANVEAVKTQLALIKDKVSAEEAKELKEITTLVLKIRKDYQERMSKTIDKITELKKKVETLEKK